MTQQAPFVVGVAGWKNSGKTTLVERLVAALVQRGFTVSTVKHSHHDVAFEKDGTDSARHRDAGASEVAVISPKRWAVLHETQNIPGPTLTDILARLGPADIVIVEGFKHEPIRKIEVRRTGQGAGAPLAGSDPAVFAIASDHEIRMSRVPVLSLDDIDSLVHLLLTAGALPDRKETP
jgi:molybdopterin-guanine dinucleotide biosynthesis protein B